MPVSKTVIRSSILSLTVLPVLALAACGDGGSGGIQPSPYNLVPYTMERTAGTGVAYVRGHMMPPKETKTTTMMQENKAIAEPVKTAPPPPAPEPVLKGDKVFEKRQAK